MARQHAPSRVPPLPWQAAPAETATSGRRRRTLGGAHVGKAEAERVRQPIGAGRMHARARERRAQERGQAVPQIGEPVTPSAASSASASSQARPSPTIPATFSVPGRRPPLVTGAEHQIGQVHARRARRAARHPWARRACARPPTAGRRPVHPRRTGILPTDWAASVCIRAPVRAGGRGQRGHRLQRAGLVVGVHDRDQGRAGADQLRGQASASTRPSASTGATRVVRPSLSRCRQTSVTAGCSTAEMTRSRRPRRGAQSRRRRRWRGCWLRCRRW